MELLNEVVSWKIVFHYSCQHPPSLHSSLHYIHNIFCKKEFPRPSHEIGSINIVLFVACLVPFFFILFRLVELSMKISFLFIFFFPLAFCSHFKSRKQQIDKVLLYENKRAPIYYSHLYKLY